MATAKKVVHLSLAERRTLGKELRKKVPPASHAEWGLAGEHPDHIALLEEQNERRDQDLVPIRHGRMMVSPFTFYRGSARVMAYDLAGTPRSGLTVQLCGDAHLLNFGVYASPERQVLFGLNDFDETLPGPFEYDVKRLAASFVLAARSNGFARADQRLCTLEAVRAYRLAMAEFAQTRTLDIWYAKLSEGDLLAAVRKARKDQKTAAGKALAAAEAERAAKNIERAHTRDSLQAFGRLAELVDGRYRIVSRPPVVVPSRELYEAYGLDPDLIGGIIHTVFRAYRATLQYDRRTLLERFRIVDVARKVVGVGSVGTRDFIVLLQGRDEDDPLFLQVKEATASVLEDHLPRSRFRQAGERVVQGQRLMQAASDIFLGWVRGLEPGRTFYIRQLHDMKGSVDVAGMQPLGLMVYARLCGWTLARAHARSGDPVALAAYLGKGDEFDKAVTKFAVRYADHDELDHAAFVRAVKDGRLQAVEGV
jgi:uncharacterized protein (DUF2252 family)